MQNRKNGHQNNYYKSRTLAEGQLAGYQQSPKARHRWLRRLISLAIIVVVVVAICCLISSQTITKLYDPKLPVVSKTTSAKPSQPGLSPVVLATMSNAINGVINQNSNIDMSVSLIDLSDNQLGHYGDSDAFTAASTTKVITAADFLNQVELGQQSLSESIDGSTAESEIQQMIVVSNDDAWDDLNNILGFSQLQTYANSIGLSSFQSEPNTVTSNDMALILEKLYDGELLNSGDTQLLLSYMEQANYREYIVPAVPSGDTIYHKIGLYEDNVHDEAIITSGSKAFVIVIFTNGNGAYNWPARAVMMQQITEAALGAYF